MFKVNFAIVCLIVLALCASSVAGVITWGPAQNTSAPGDVSTNSTLNEAINMVGVSQMPGSTTVNGVLFTNDDTKLPQTYAAAMLGGNSTGDAGYDVLLDSVDYGGGSATSIAVGSGLSVGAGYEIQLWYTDLRSFADPFTMGYGDGNGNKVILDSDSGGLGQYVIGTFVADGSTQTLNISTGPSGSGPPGNCHLNAYQIRGPICTSVGTVVELDNPMQVEEADVDGTAVGFSVVLEIEPGATDTITVDIDPNSNGNGVDVTVNPAQLTFTSADWDTPQTVTVKAIDDTVQDSGESRTDIIDFTVTSAESDSRYADGCPLDTVSVTIVGNDLGCGDWGYLPEDLNLDCYVNLADFAEFALDYLDGVCVYAFSDFSGDGKVDLEDLFFFTGAYLNCTNPTDPNCQESASPPSSDDSGPWAINADTETNDSKPCYTVLPDGSTWVVWHGYRDRRDRILARQVRPDRLGAIWQLSEHGTVHDDPVMTVVGCQLQVYWSLFKEGRWQIAGRRFAGDAWEPTVLLSEDGVDIFQPAMTSLDNGRSLLAYTAHQGQQFRIRYRILQEDQWAEPVTVSHDGHDAQRPGVVAVADGRAWVVWDAYENNNHAVYLRQVLPHLGVTERISPAGQNCFMPAIQMTNTGLAVAWLKTTDVSTEAGVIGQINTLHMALQKQGNWHLVRDADGGDVGATLVHGLTPRMHPAPAPKWGHMAPLRIPRLLADGDTVWLLWERKTEDTGEPADATADLAARPCRDGTWGPSVIFTSGLIDYHLAEPARTNNGKFPVVASQLPRQQRREYHLMTCDTNVQQPFQQDEWLGWNPINLPLTEEPPGRHEIEVGDQTYRLYWVDLHNHSSLTCDCEGEPDELFRYGRDRACIDGMALIDNDEVFDDPLTEAEYAYGAFMARCFNEPGRFVALPGYEWTSYLPNPNHRTVIYPLSGGPLLNHTEIGNNIELMLETVHEYGGVVFPHHPSWDPPLQAAEVGCEVTSAWSISFNASLIHSVLNGGHRLGFAGNSDSHRRNPGLAGGLTAVYAPELTSEAILAALHQRRFYATNGSKIVVDSRANGTLFGQETQAPNGVVEISLHAIGTRPIVSAELIHNGESVKTYHGNGQRELRAVFQSPKLPVGKHWYYWNIAQEGSSPYFPGSACVAQGHLAWCTPHWVTVP